MYAFFSFLKVLSDNCLKKSYQIWKIITHPFAETRLLLYPIREKSFKNNLSVVDKGLKNQKKKILIRKK